MRDAQHLEAQEPPAAMSTNSTESEKETFAETDGEDFTVAPSLDEASCGDVYIDSWDDDLADESWKDTHSGLSRRHD